MGTALATDAILTAQSCFERSYSTTSVLSTTSSHHPLNKTDHPSIWTCILTALVRRVSQITADMKVFGNYTTGKKLNREMIGRLARGNGATMAQSAVKRNKKRDMIKGAIPENIGSISEG